MKSVDPITLAVVEGYIIDTVAQMRATLIRTAYAPTLYDTHDLSCAMLSPKGEIIGMSEGEFTGHVMPMAWEVRGLPQKFGDRIYPGDVLMMNDPYTGGSHLNDVAFYSPFFAEGKLLLFIAVRAHFTDVGGATPGSFSGQDTEIYQEGVRIPPVKLFERGELNQGLWDVVFANMRLQEEREGDALAMLDTLRVGEMRVSELCTKYGPETIEMCFKTFLDRGERTMRQRISQLPPGEYYYEQYVDNSGLAPDPLPIKVKMTIESDTMLFDFTGSSPKIVGPTNCGPAVTEGAVFVVVKSWLDPKSRVSGGAFRPLKFIIPEGSILSATLPTPVGGVWEIFRPVQSTVVGLFSQVLPEHAGGENMGATNHVFISGYDATRGIPYILYQGPTGGNPGTSTTDGSSAHHPYDGGDIPTTHPAESVEQKMPVLIEGVGLRTDAEAPGRRRSGLGAVVRVKVLSDSGQLNVMTDRAIIPPWGASGGYPGSCNAFTVLRDGEEIQPSPLPGKVKSFPLQYGDIVVMRATAGGGVGDPLTRETELVKRDLLQGYITPQRARDVYGVVFENGEVDPAKTQELRRELGQRRRYYEVVESGRDDFDPRGCRLCPLSRRVADQIGVKDRDMMEYVAQVGPPLRAWVKVADDALGEGVSIGPIGRKILNVSGGDRVWVRALTTYAITT